MTTPKDQGKLKTQEFVKTQIKAPPKIRILVYTSSPTVPTGFGVAAKEILTRLYMVGQNHGGQLFPKYEIQIIGIDFKPGDKHDFPFHICTTRDEWGIEKLVEVVRREDFDVFFIMQDIHVFGMSGRDPNRKVSSVIDILNNTHPDRPIVTYFPVDRSPVSFVYIDKCLRRCDLNFVQSEFGKNQVREAWKYRGDKPIHCETLYNGVNTNTFFPMPEDEREKIRAKRGVENVFVIINVNRNQPRKNINSSLRAVSLFGEGYNICECGNYYSLKKQECDLCFSNKTESKVKGVSDILLLLHMNSDEPTMGNTKLDRLENLVCCAGFSNTSGKMVTITNAFGKNKLNLADINQFYNLADIYLTTTYGEGVGLTSLEALATGTPVIAPRNSALLEYVGGAGTLVPCVGHVSLARDMGAQRPLVSVPKVVDALRVEYLKWLENGKRKVINTKALEHVKKFTWDDCVRTLDQAFTSVLGKRRMYTGVKKL